MMMRTQERDGFGNEGQEVEGTEEKVDFPLRIIMVMGT
jgi:hypothetical protein